MAPRKTANKPTTMPGNVAGIPMPEMLPVEMTSEFNELVNHMAARAGVVDTEDVPLLENLLMHRYACRMAFEDIRINGPLVDGKSNPAVAMLAIQSGAAVKVAAALALGPAARAKLKSPPTNNAANNPWTTGG